MGVNEPLSVAWHPFRLVNIHFACKNGLLEHLDVFNAYDGKTFAVLNILDTKLVTS